MNLIDEKKYSEVVLAAKELTDRAAMVQFLHLMREAYDLQHVFFAVFDKGSSASMMMCGTYPEQWQRYYDDCQLVRVDPIFRWANEHASPLLWNKMENLAPEEDALMKLRHEHGIGPLGMTIPLMSMDGAISLLSITGNMDPESWMKRARVLFKEFREIGLVMHAAYLREHGFKPAKVDLSQRHIDCIRMIGHGMNLEEVAEFQGLTQKTVKNHLKEARSRLRARNNAQLLFNAIQLGFIEAPGDPIPMCGYSRR